MRSTPHLIRLLCAVAGIYLVWRRVAELRPYSFQLSYTSLEVAGTPKDGFPAVRSGNNIDTRFSKSFSRHLRPPAKAILMGKLSTEDTSWVTELLPYWHHAIYTVNDTSAPVHTARNKGREANAYLTYILQHYNRLPQTNVFIHSHRKGWPAAWHTDASDHDIVVALNDLNTSHVQAEGYVNLRCSLDPGCSPGGSIQPLRHVNDTKPLNIAEAAEVAWVEAWPQLFGAAADRGALPEEISAPCCAQFAVSREQVLRKPLEYYQWLHAWSMETELSDDVSGRIFEYAWHMIFGKPVVQ